MPTHPAVALEEQFAVLPIEARDRFMSSVADLLVSEDAADVAAAIAANPTARLTPADWPDT